MSRMHLNQASFNGGALSTRMQARTDTAVYRIGMAEMLNYAPTVEGPAVKCPGFRYIRPADPSAAWVSSYIFNRRQAYLLEWSDNAVRFYTNGGRIEGGLNDPYEVAVPYMASDAPRISQQKSNDRLYLARAGFPFGALRRDGATDFAYETVTLKNGPFGDPNIDRTNRVVASAVSGSVTLTADDDAFLPGHVGAPFRLEAEDFADVPAWEPGITVTAGQRRRSDGKVYQCAQTGRTGSVQPIHDSGTEYDGMATGEDVNELAAGGVRWTYLHGRFGELTITGYTDARTVSATVTKRLPDSCASTVDYGGYIPGEPDIIFPGTGGSWKWTHGAFSDAAGWPHHCLIWAGRLVLFGERDIYGSVAGDYLNHQDETSSGLVSADLAFHYRLAATDPIVWVVADTQLIIGTESEEYAIGPRDAGQAVGPGNLNAVSQGAYGSAEVWSRRIGKHVLFVQRGGRKMREAKYEFSEDRYVALNKTIFARDIAGEGPGAGFVQMAYAQEPEDMLWAVRKDGRLACHAYSPEQEVKGWAVRELGGGARVLSAADLPSEDGSVDELWILAEDAKGRRSIEVMDPWWIDARSIESAFFVDSGLSRNTAPSSLVAAAHLAGETVSVLADGVVYEKIKLDVNGWGQLPKAHAEVHLGRPYTARLVTLRPDTQDDRLGFPGARVRKVLNVMARVLEAGGLWGGPLAGALRKFDPRPLTVPMDTAQRLKSGLLYDLAAPGDPARGEGQVVIESRDPLPSIVPNIVSVLDMQGD
ncbi:hypothetical protein ACSMXM_01340 [Pacificimonas sp. ICDLI1SI03]